MGHSRFLSDNVDNLGSSDLAGSPPGRVVRLDSDDHIDVTVRALSLSYIQQPSHSVSQGFVDHPPKYDLSQSHSGPPYPSPDLSLANSQFDSGTRISRGLSSKRTVERFMHCQPLVHPRHLLQQPNLSYSQHQLQFSAYNGVAPPGWSPKVERLQLTSGCQWLGNNDRQSGSMGGYRQAPYSPSTPSSAWSNSSNDLPTSSTSPIYFPTLNIPFYSYQSNVVDYPISFLRLSNPHPMSPIYEAVNHTST
jgi:hypothetical protein